MQNVIETAAQAEKKGISGSTLKLIAIITMFIDHFAAIIMERVMVQKAGGMANLGYEFVANNPQLYGVYMILRMIGRLGFPIFCFLLIEGFTYTRNMKKYAIRLLMFAFVSELPFDLGFCGKPINWSYQNVFFTLFVGLMVMIAFRFVEQKQQWNQVLRVIMYILIAAAGMGVAELLKTDYSAMGVLTIIVMYLFRRSKMLQTGLGCAVLTFFSITEITAFLILIPVHMYNGKRGWNIKWFFYAFYPLHILLLYLIAYAMGLGNIVLR